MPDQKKYDYRLNVYVTFELQHKLEQIRDQRGPKVTVPDIVREALRLYVDQEEDIIGSRRHFQRHLREVIESVKDELLWNQLVLLALVWQGNATLLGAIKTPHVPFKDSFEQALLFAVRNWEPLVSILETNRQKAMEQEASEKP